MTMSEMKIVSYVKGPQNRQDRVGANKAKEERINLFKEKSFEFRVKLLQGQAGHVEEKKQ